MKDKTMIQCELRKGTRTETAWIPEKFAVVGKFLRILDDDGWKVSKSFRDTKLSEDYVRRHQWIVFDSIK